jgi:methionyl-tRNA formyltransferase
VFGAGEGIAKVLTKIYKNKLFLIKAVVPRINRINGTLENSQELETLAKEYGIKIITARDINEETFLNDLKLLAPQLIINWGYGQIFKKELLNVAPFGALNFHPGLLPFGRGSGAVVGEIWNSATEVGQSAHFMDEHIDKGRVVASRKFSITGLEYQDQINELLSIGADDFFISAIDKVFKGEKGTLVDDFGRYYPKYIQGDDIVNWEESSELIIRKIRSRSPYRLSRIYKNPDKQEIFIRKASLSNINNYYSPTGQVIDRSDKGILVKTADNAIWIEEISFDENIFTVPKYSIGTSFTSNWQFEILELRKQLKEITFKLDSLKAESIQKKNEELDPLFHCPKCQEKTQIRFLVDKDYLKCAKCENEFLP